MHQLLNSKGRIICFPPRITETMEKIYDYPLIRREEFINIIKYL